MRQTQGKSEVGASNCDDKSGKLHVLEIQGETTLSKDLSLRADAFFTLRLRSADKLKLAQAAERGRRSLASYVIESALRRAEREQPEERQAA